MLRSANEFCTLTDLRFLPQALVLQQSLASVCSDYRLRIFCLDDVSLTVLTGLRPHGCEPVPFSRVESHDPELEMITYLDADLMFFSDPACVLGELGEDSVLLFPQRIASRDRAWSEAAGEADAAERLNDMYGKFNAGSITFRNDLRGRAALDWWRERCLEWCFDRFEPGHWSAGCCGTPTSNALTARSPRSPGSRRSMRGLCPSWPCARPRPTPTTRPT